MKNASEHTKVFLFQSHTKLNGPANSRENGWKNPLLAQAQASAGLGIKADPY